MRESVRMVVVLTLIAMVSAGVLSQVYSYTNEIIQANLARELESSIFDVLPNVASARTIDAGSASLVEDDRSTLRERGQEQQLLLFEALDANNQPVGFAFVGEGNGYGGVVKVLVGVDLDNKITGIKILEHLETPGLGSRIEGEGFRNQFVGKTSNDRFRVGQDIDNISGATESANAVSEAVRNGFPRAVAAYEGGR